MESAPSEDCWNDRKDLDYNLNLIDKAGAEIERTDFRFQRIPLWVNCYQIASHVTK